jgi:hypothetical protein
VGLRRGSPHLSRRYLDTSGRTYRAVPTAPFASLSSWLQLPTEPPGGKDLATMPYVSQPEDEVERVRRGSFEVEV